jgi:hypothetical protein
MRPVDRGAIPLDAAGNPKTWTRYQDARLDLIGRLGDYCSYCEMRLEASLAVEHVLPKILKPESELSWDNFLLACTNCNSTKGKKEIALDDFLWPDRADTFRVFLYGPGCMIRAADGLTEQEMQRAEKTLGLTGLDKYPPKKTSASDRRWIKRQDAWGIAERAKKRLRDNPTEAMRDQIADTAKLGDYWSVWMTVFADDADMRRRLVSAFVGTHPAYFTFED